MLKLRMPRVVVRVMVGAKVEVIKGREKVVVK